MDAKLASDIGISVKVPQPPMMTILRRPDGAWAFMKDLAPFWEFLTFLDQVWLGALKYPITYERDGQWP